MNTELKIGDWVKLVYIAAAPGDWYWNESQLLREELRKHFTLGGIYQIADVFQVQGKVQAVSLEFYDSNQELDWSYFMCVERLRKYNEFTEMVREASEEL